MTLVVDSPSRPDTELRSSRPSSAQSWRTAQRPPFTIRMMLTAAAATIAVLSGVLVLNLVFISRLEHSAVQHRLFTSFRNALALGVAPVNQVDSHNHLYPLGTPVAIIRIPRIGVNEVVAEGTTPQVLTGGPGHLRTTVLPGEAGICQVFGRAAGYGGPFSRIGSLRRGALITAVDGLGRSEYRVIDVRRAGDLAPALPRGAGRLTLLTASGSHFAPSGVLRVDADLVSPQAVTATLGPVLLSHSEFAMNGDDESLWQMVFWIEALVLVCFGATWAWSAWGRAQAAIVFAPPFLVVSFYLSDQVTRLLPNML